MTEKKPDVFMTEHREAIAWAVFDYQHQAYANGARAADGKAPGDLDHFRILVQEMRYRMDVLENPQVMSRYIQARGFDPREARVARQPRWL